MRSLTLALGLFTTLLPVLVGCTAAADSGEEAVATDGSEVVATPNDFYVIAHMTNTPAAARWAVAEGANAVEIDLRFADDGAPRAFRHGGVCDCICSLGHDDHVCAALVGDCEATSSVADMLGTVASLPDVALVVVDSKVTGDEPLAVQRAAGAGVIDALGDDLFARGYRGKVIVGAAKTTAVAYVAAAVQAAAASRWSSRISFAFDQMGKSESDAACTLRTLGALTERRAFGTGISACATGDYTPAIREAAASERAGASGLTYAWTLDKESSMRRYIDAGARGIITNRPRRLAEVARSMGKALARPNTAIPVATSAATAGDAQCGGS